MRVLILTLCGSTLAASLPLQAQEPRAPASGPVVEATAGNYALQLRYLAASPFQPVTSDLDYGLLFSDQHNVIGSAAWMFHTSLDLVPHLSFQLGPQAYVASLAQQNRSVLAVALGGDVRLQLIPRYDIAAFGSAFYGPSVLIFGSADNVYDFAAGIQVRFAPRLRVEGGYRWFKFTLENSANDTIQNGVFVGVRWDLGG